MSLMMLYEQMPIARAVDFLRSKKRATLRDILSASGIRESETTSIAYLERNLGPERIYRVDGVGLDTVYAYQPERAS